MRRKEQSTILILEEKLINPRGVENAIPVHRSRDIEQEDLISWPGLKALSRVAKVERTNFEASDRVIDIERRFRRSPLEHLRNLHAQQRGRSAE